MAKMKLILLAILLVGCGRDRDAEDYQKEKRADQLEKIQSIQGNYSGHLLASGSKEKWGALRISLTSASEVQNNNPEEGPISQPILLTSLEFLGTQRLSLTAQKSSYDPESRLLVAEVQLQNTIIMISAEVKEGALVGKIESRGHSNFGGQFELLSSNPSLDSLNQKIAPSARALWTQLRFLGQSSFKFGPSTREAEYLIQQDSSSASEQFAQLLSPLKTTSFTVNFGGGTKLTFPTALLDLQTGTLKAQQTSQEGVMLDLACSLGMDSSFIIGGLNCSLNNSTVSGPVALFTGEYNIEKTSPEGFLVQPSLEKKMSGKTRPLPETSDRSFSVLMTLQRPSLSRTEELQEQLYPISEKKVQVTLVLDPEGLRSVLNLKDLIWDENAKSLRGSSSVNFGNQQVLITLNCDGLRLDSPEPFSCSYRSSSQTFDLWIDF